MATFLVGMEYDGTAYNGFQIQPGLPTIQGQVEQALAAVMHEPVRITGAGRTDTGVHAKGQTASFRAEWHRPAEQLIAALNANLPEDIAVRWAHRMPDRFDARHSARARMYRYVVERTRLRTAFSVRYSHRVGCSLDEARMVQALECTVGTHDFGAFGVAPGDPPGEMGTVRTLYRVRLGTSGRWLWIDYLGNAFLRHMVRTLSGAVLKVGSGQMELDEFQGLVQKRSGSHNTPHAAPARGLWLMKVLY